MTQPEPTHYTAAEPSEKFSALEHLQTVAEVVHAAGEVAKVILPAVAEVIRPAPQPSAPRDATNRPEGTAP